MVTVCKCDWPGQDYQQCSRLLCYAGRAVILQSFCADRGMPIERCVSELVNFCGRAGSYHSDLGAQLGGR